MNNKRGQVTIFIIIAVLVVAGIALAAVITSLYFARLATVGMELPALAQNDGVAQVDDLPTIPTEADVVYGDVPAVTDEDHIIGSKDASVVMIEYSDIECPFCGRHHPNMAQLMEEFEGQVAWVYRHFPLSFHPEALPAAVAAECAGEQDKFWDFLDTMFENQDKWSTERGDVFIGYVEELGLNTEMYVESLKSKEIKSKVDSDYKSGLSLGVNSTPSFFLNGKKIVNPRSYEEFRNLIQKIIDEKVYE